MQLEAILGHVVCGISGCCRPARHSGECCRAERTDGRKRKPKAAFEPDPTEVQVQRKPKSPRGFAKDAARRPSIAVPSAQQRAADHSTALVPAPSTALVLSVNAEALDEIPNMRTAPDFLSTFKQAHPNPFSPIADVSDNALEAAKLPGGEMDSLEALAAAAAAKARKRKRPIADVEQRRGAPYIWRETALRLMQAAGAA
eukprot:1686790-Prymnesium_polylepis.1